MTTPARGPHRRPLRVVFPEATAAEIRRMARAGYGVPAIARFLKVPADAVAVMLRREGLRNPPGARRQAPVTLASTAPPSARRGRLPAGESRRAIEERHPEAPQPRRKQRGHPEALQT